MPQEDLPETDLDTFHQFADKFHLHIAATGASTVLLAAWPYERCCGMCCLCPVHASFLWPQGHRKGARVAPTGNPIGLLSPETWLRVLTAQMHTRNHTQTHTHAHTHTLIGLRLCLHAQVAGLRHRSYS